MAKTNYQGNPKTQITGHKARQFRAQAAGVKTPPKKAK